jgi:branched-chain amino acid aminotransferase
MPMTKTDKIWMNGQFVAWDDAKVHVLAHVLHYGSSVFEGIRAYQTRAGTSIYRLEDHIERLFFSAKVYRMKIPFTREQIERACIETVAVNRLNECYIRPLVYRGYENIGVNPVGVPIDVAIAAYPWGKYLGDEALAKGVSVKVGTWARLAANTMPAMAKAGGNYLNSQLLRLEAADDGYAEAIALDPNGYLSEGSGENLFVVHKGILYTPGIASSILMGITRDSVMRIARDLGYEVREQALPREMLYAADELFFVGTAVEVTPITAVDRLPVGNGERGPLTKAIQDAYFAVVRGENPRYASWLTTVPVAAAVPRA